VLRRMGPGARRTARRTRRHRKAALLAGSRLSDAASIVA
jgi:hypothetical protein